MIDTEKNKKKVISLLKSTKRENINKLIDAMKKSDFFIAPASSKYHLNEKGGLVQHSLNVYDVAKHLNKKYKLQIKRESIIISALLHDLCKIHNYLYNPITKKFRRRLLAPKNHGIRSLKLIKEYIELLPKEELMIRWHMGRYTWDANFMEIEDDLKKDYPETLVLYFADHISTVFLEGNNGKS